MWTFFPILTGCHFQIQTESWRADVQTGGQRRQRPGGGERG